MEQFIIILSRMWSIDPDKGKTNNKIPFLLPNKENEQEAVGELSFMADCI